MPPDGILNLMHEEYEKLKLYKVGLSIPALGYGAMKGFVGIKGIAASIPEDLKFMQITPDNCMQTLTILQPEINTLPAEQLTDLDKSVGHIALQTRQLFLKRYLKIDPKDSFKQLPQDLKEPPFILPGTQSTLTKNTVSSPFTKLVGRLRK